MRTTAHRLPRIMMAAVLAALTLALSGCGSGGDVTALGEAVCENTNRQLAAAAEIEETDAGTVKMLVIHLEEAAALGRLDDQRIRNLATIQKAIAEYVRTGVSGAPTRVELPEGWELALHRAYREVGLNACANRGSEYPGRNLGGSTPIAPGTPPTDGPLPAGLDSPSFAIGTTGNLFEIEQVPGVVTAPTS